MDEFTPRHRIQIKKDLHDESCQNMSIIEDKDYDRIIKKTNNNIIIKRVPQKDCGNVDPFGKIKKKRKKKKANAEPLIALVEYSYQQSSDEEKSS